MTQAIFDFDKIKTIEEFYADAVCQLRLPGYFGNNLDALWDCVTADVALPAQITFINLSKKDLKKFEDLITLFQDAEKELSQELSFQYFPKTKNSDKNH